MFHEGMVSHSVVPTEVESLHVWDAESFHSRRTLSSLPGRH
jgi:hypothetical protein